MPGSTAHDIANAWLCNGPPRQRAKSASTLPAARPKQHYSAVYCSSARLPPQSPSPRAKPTRPSSARVPVTNQDIGFSRIASQSGARTPRPEKHDLESKLSDAGVPRRYLKGLEAMGFDDVAQLLHLGRLGQPLDDVLDALNLSPGHRVTVGGWLQREAAAADAAVQAEVRSLRASAEVGRTASVRIQNEANARADAQEALAASREQNAQLLAQLEAMHWQARLLAEGRKLRTPAGGPNVDQILRRHLRHEASRALHRGLRGWRLHSARVRRRRALQRTVSSMRSPQLSRAWRAWGARTGAARAALRLVRAAVARWRDEQLSAAMNKWYDVLEAARKRALRRRRLRGAMTPQGRAFAKWRRGAGRRWAARQLAARVLGRATRAEARPLATWRHFAEVRSQSRRRLLHAARRLVGGALVRCWQRWSAAAAERRQAAGAVGAALARWTQQSLVYGWNVWVEKCARGARARAAMTRWALPGLSRAFGAWVASGARFRAARRAMRHWQGGLLYRTFDAWRVDVRETRRARADALAARPQGRQLWLLLRLLLLLARIRRRRRERHEAELRGAGVAGVAGVAAASAESPRAPRPHRLKSFRGWSRIRSVAAISPE